MPAMGPLMRRARLRSFGMIVTRFAWIAQSIVSSNKCTCGAWNLLNRRKMWMDSKKYSVPKQVHLQNETYWVDVLATTLVVSLVSLIFRSPVLNSLLLCLCFFVFTWIWVVTFLSVLRRSYVPGVCLLLCRFAISLRCNTTESII